MPFGAAHESKLRTVFNQPESDDSRLDTALGNYDGNAERIHLAEEDTVEGETTAVVVKMGH